MSKLLLSGLLFTAICVTACKGTPDRTATQSMKSVTTQPMAKMSAVNATCPITSEAVDETSAMVAFGDVSVALCCDGCKSEWDGWSADQKQTFVTAALSH